MRTPRRRAVLLRKLRQIRTKQRRWIYLATEKYAAILRASITPSALQSEAAREAVLTSLCSRSSVTRAVVEAEIKAVRQLDLPYFVRKTAESMPADRNTVPPELIQAIRTTILSTRALRRKKR